MNQSRLFHPGNDLNPPPGRRTYPLQKCLGISGVPQSAGRDHSHTVGNDLLRGPVKAPQNFNGLRNGIGRQKPGSEHSLAESRDLAILMQ